MKNILFIANNTRTNYFINLSLEFQRRGYEIYWICTSKYYYNKLSTLYNKNNILFFRFNKKNYVDSDIVNSFEKMSLFTINKFILMDRGLRKYKNNKGILIVKQIITKITNYINLHNIKNLYSETTWAIELITYFIIKNNNGNYYHLSYARLPGSRGIVFTSFDQSKILEIDDKFKSENKLTYDDIKEYVLSGSKPQYIDAQIGKRKFNERIFKIRHLIHILVHSIIDRNDIMRTKFIYWFKYHIFKKIKRFIVRIVTKSIKNIENKKFIYYPIQFEPEASVDVYGYKVNNQYEIIKSISECLPSDVFCFVKDHPTGFGRLRLSFYLNSIRLPNVFFIDEYITNNEILKKSIAYVSISSTACYEASLLGATSFLCSDVYFTQLSSVIKYNSLNDLKVKILKHLESKNKTYNHNEDIYLINNILSNTIDILPGCEYLNYNKNNINDSKLVDIIDNAICK